MNRSDTHRRISALCRGSHHTSLYAVGYLTQAADLGLLEELLDAIEEFHETVRPKLPDTPVDRARELLTERFQ